MSNDIILKERFPIYNNLAKSGDSSGRLSVTYDIYPSPAIFWEFETFDNGDIEFDPKTREMHPFTGYNFEMPRPFLGSPNKNPLHRPLGQWFGGGTPRVLIGDQGLIGKSFFFLLPNAIFQEIASLKNAQAKEVSYRQKDAEPIFGSGWREGYLEAKIGNFRLTLHTPVEALDWMKSFRSTGTYITTSGTLEVDTAVSIFDAVKLLEDIAHLLSFANGGLVAPLVVSKRPDGVEEKYPGIYSVYRVDPIEYTGAAWISWETDLSDLLECLPSFQKMLQSQQWDRDFFNVLTWYFQAIQPQGVQRRGKQWPIVANALGAALEKLASIILPNDKNVQGMSLETKIKELLKLIEVDPGPKMAGHDAVWWFKEMRNDATHAKRNHTWNQEEVGVILGNAIQWVEETLLWRLGYKGVYRDRSRGDRFTTSSRYNLATRDPSW